MLNSKGEVADFLDVSQFIPGRSAYECVAYSASLIYYSGEPNKGASGTTQQASNLAQYWYGREEGSTAAANTNGMSVAAMYNMLDGMGLKHAPCAAVWRAGVPQAIAEGFPVMLCVHENSVFDLDLNDHVPYAWTPTGNHCIVVSGVASDGNFLVHDCANVAPSGVRPGPRRYDAAKLQIVSATAVTPRWKGEQSMSGVPQGWHDDGTVLTSPASTQGGVPLHITGPFREYILSNPWPPANVAISEGVHVEQLEASNPSLGSGWQQVFRFAMLGKPDNGAMTGQVVYEWLGIELEYLRTKSAQLESALSTKDEQIKALQSQLAASHDPNAVTNRLTALGQLGHQIETLATQPLS